MGHLQILYIIIIPNIYFDISYKDEHANLYENIKYNIFILYQSYYKHLLLLTNICLINYYKIYFLYMMYCIMFMYCIYIIIFIVHSYNVRCLCYIHIFNIILNKLCIIILLMSFRTIKNDFE